MPIARPGSIEDVLARLRELLVEERRRRPPDEERIAEVIAAGKALASVQADADATPEDAPANHEVRRRLSRALTLVVSLHPEWEEHETAAADLVTLVRLVEVRAPGPRPVDMSWVRSRKRGGGNRSTHRRGSLSSTRTDRKLGCRPRVQKRWRAMPGDLYYGDNLDVLRHKVASESVDLVYLDPPFNSDRTYNLIHKESQAQERAFHDSWHWDDAAESAYADLTGHAPQGVRVPASLSEMMVALRNFMWPDHQDTLAYLSMMAIRLVEMRRILRGTGSLYLHCDPTASHYLKLILDAVFGANNFRSEVIWKRMSAHSTARRYGPIHDTILYYTKSDNYVWNAARHGKDETKSRHDIYRLADGTIVKTQDLTGTGTRNGRSGMPWRGFDPNTIGRHWRCTVEKLDQLDSEQRIYWPSEQGKWPRFITSVDEDRGNILQDVWTDIGPVNSGARERVGYPTQKPLALLQRIIGASSNAGDAVLDPFCGCGTTVEAAEQLDRKWVGIDIAIRAIDVIKDRLDERFQSRVWKEYGEPSDVESAARLADTNPYDFQWWAVRKLGGQPPKGEKKKGGDGGIDGEMVLRDFDSATQRRVLLSVKGGRSLNPDMVKALKTTVDLAKADYGILVTMHPPTQGMKTLAREFGSVGGVRHDGKPNHKIRIITVPEMFAGTVQLPGRNLTPRSNSSPPPPEPRKGENLQLPFPATSKPTKQKSKSPGVVKAPAPEPMRIAAGQNKAAQRKRR